MTLRKHKKYLILITIIGLIFTTRYIVYGSFFKTCTYTENEIHMNEEMLNSKIYFTRSAAVIENIEHEYSCLDKMSFIHKKIIQNKNVADYKYQITDKNIKYLNENSLIEFTPVKLLAISKHGITSIDSGTGPINYLILKDQNGEFYEVATVSLGLNKGEEFLKSKYNGQETLLNSDTNFSNTSFR